MLASTAWLCNVLTYEVRARRYMVVQRCGSLLDASQDEGVVTTAQLNLCASADAVKVEEHSMPCVLACGLIRMSQVWMVHLLCISAPSCMPNTKSVFWSTPAVVGLPSMNTSTIKT